MYLRKSYSTLPLLVLASVASLAVADGSPGLFHSPQSSYAPPNDQYLSETPYAGGYAYEEEYPAGRIVRSISNQLKKWVVGNPNHRKDTETVFHAAEPAPKAETVEVKIPACDPVTEYITTRITQNVAVRTHCMMKSVYRHPHKKDLMHQSSKCRGYLCNPQLFFDPSNPSTTSLRLPISMGPNPLASIFSNIDYDYDPSIGLDALSVENIDIPEYDYNDDINRQGIPLPSPIPSFDTAVKGVLVHVDRNFDFSKPNFGLPDHLFKPEIKSKQLDYYDQSYDDYNIDYEYDNPSLEYKPPVDNESFRSSLSDYDYDLSLEYKPPVDDDSLRSSLSDYDYDPSPTYEAPRDDDIFRSSLSDYDSLEDSSPIDIAPLSNIIPNPPTIFSNVSFHSPRYYFHYSPNYAIPPESKGIDLSHSLRLKLPDNIGIPLPNVKNVNSNQRTSFSPNVGIPIPNNGIDVGIGLSQGSTVPKDFPIGLQDPTSGIGIPLPSNGVSSGIPIPNNGMSIGIGLPQDSIGLIDSQIGIQNPSLGVGIPIPGIPKAEHTIPNNGPNVGIPIPNFNMNLGMPMSQDSIILIDSQTGIPNPNLNVGIPIPNTDRLIPNNGVNVGIGLPQDSTSPIDSQIRFQDTVSGLGISLSKANNFNAVNGMNIGAPIPNTGMIVGISLPQDSTAPIHSQIGFQDTTSGLGIPLSNANTFNTNNGVNVDTPIPNNGFNVGIGLPQDSASPIDSQFGFHDTASGVGISLPNTDRTSIGPQGPIGAVDSQLGIQNPNLSVGIPIPNADNPISNNGASAINHIPNNGMNVGIGLPRDSAGPILSNLGIHNPNLNIGIPIPNANNPIPNNGQNVGIPILNIDMNLGTALIDSQIPRHNPTSSVGIPLPNTDRTSIGPQRPIVVVDSQSGLQNPNLSVGIPIPNADNPITNNGASAINHIPNNGMNVGIGLPRDSTGPILSNLGIHNPNLNVGIPIPNADNPISNNGQNVGIPILNIDMNLSTAQIDSQIPRQNPTVDVGIPLPNTDKLIPNNDVSAHVPITNNGMNVGIGLPQDSIGTLNSQLGIHNPALGVGIPIPNAGNPISNNGQTNNNVNVGIPLPQDSASIADSQNIINHSNLDVGIPIPNVKESVPNNGINAHSPFPNNDMSIGIPLPQDSAVRKVINHSDLEVYGFPKPNVDNSVPNNDFNVGISLPGLRNNLVDNTYPSHRFTEIVKLDLEPVSFDFLKASSSYSTVPNQKRNKYFKIPNA